MTTGVVLFTRDLRVHDHPALFAAVEEHDHVVPLFVLDDAILASRYAAPNRLRFLHDSLRDLRGALVDRGASLVLRRGDVAEQVAAVCDEVDAAALHVSRDVSRYAVDRRRALEDVCAERDVDLVLHPGILVVQPGELTTGSGDPYRVYSPYWRRWRDTTRREPVAAPDRVPLPSTVQRGSLPARDEFVGAETSPDLMEGGETAGRARLDWWFDGPIEDYDETRNHLADDGTSRLSPHLHFGTVSAAEVAARVDRRNPGHDAFVQELCWRDFNAQLFEVERDLPRRDLRDLDDRWRDDPELVEAWKQGRTGFPIVDAGMRQLRQEGWMHNRARMITAVFLTKLGYVDWRTGAWHFLDWLVDGDIANNMAQWQWSAGTGVDRRPNRIFNPMSQAKRYDPDATYVKRYVPELADLDPDEAHEPWRLDEDDFARLDYPGRILDYDEARVRFAEARD